MTIGTHLGRLSDEARKRREPKNARNRQRRGEDRRRACNTYDACRHPNHGFTPGKLLGRTKNNRSQRWPVPV